MAIPRESKSIPFENQLKAVDFFCGAGGMSYGLARAGFRVLGGIDNDPECKETYKQNNKPSKFLCSDICDLEYEELANEFGIEANNDRLVFVGCSPCQFWSKINTDRTRNKASAYLLNEFRRFIEHFNPGYIIIENVPGLQNKKDQTVLPQFVKFLESRDYAYNSGVVNSIKFGVPQNRFRFLLLATRVTKQIQLPKGRSNKRLTVRNFIGEKNGFPRIEAGHIGTRVRMHTVASLSEKNLQRISLTPHDGGERSSWKHDPNLQIPAYEGKDHIFRNVYGRMWWDRPAPTITTRFISLSNGRFGHPEENRALSLREGATLQTFPKRYKFVCSNHASVARLIGNAVPPALAMRLGKYLLKVANGKI